MGKFRLRERRTWTKNKHIMKKLFLSLMLVAFAVSVQAGEGKDCPKSACSAEKKAACAADAKACPASASTKAKCCPSGAKETAKVGSPKASEQVKK